ncbi:PSD1 and planctomycete cytochrome C domain-containing protein [Pirellula sp. SH-Sr6A]|uniref:PSD1 and planctomycete cytochrome C domain-containing protein n=1 Tax=Pirellula sp. SH-Sr6A TaxID=1632865 RepID=UPI00143BE2D7|nr:PSD1 and planctomycete cytochrome C domain-containing protein [Pirellula sp. SH-Sr6A]
MPFYWAAGMALLFVAPLAVFSDDSLASSESNEELVATAAQTEFFEKRIRPILESHCMECHTEAEKSGGLSLTHRGSLLQGGDTGPAIELQEPSQSLLLKAVRYQDESLKMPPNGKLSDQEIAWLEEWVGQKAPDPRPEPNDAPATPLEGMSIEEGREFWSFRPINPPHISSLSSEHLDVANAPTTPIDLFIERKWAEAGLTPAPEASRHVWLRRVTQDLTGLPPSASEIIEFEQDDAPDAYEKVVDRLLNSPQYGVHWGRHWLDTVRYADSNGLDENLAFGNAWRFRDYVIHSFNANKPFHRFIKEHLAGDLLDDASVESQTGTGFLVLGAKVLAEPDREKLSVDTIDEQIDTVGKVFLGLTFGCARCHDHKFDPVKQEDYYSLAAIFQSTRTFADSNTGAIRHWNEISIASDEERKEIAELNKEVAAKQAAYNKAKSSAMEELRQNTRAKVLDYLSASMELKPDCTLSQCVPLAEKYSLHPRVLLNCRLYLARFADGELFRVWDDCYQRQARDEMLNHYRVLFDPKSDQPEESKKAAAAALANPTGFLAVPAKFEHALTEAQIQEINRLAEEARLFESAAKDEAAVMGVRDARVTDEMPIHIRGNYLSRGRLVSRSFPKVLLGEREKPIFHRQQSGRLELAEWLVDPRHPLTSRVVVNRLWGWHFGRGIVSTTENFGLLGEKPTHPELLDFLARDFLESGWSMKEFHRMVVLSRTYRMDSSHPQEKEMAEKDPENRLLWKFPMRRLTAEEIRDGILFQLGELDLQLDGKTVPLRNRQFVFDHTSIDHTKYDMHRRTAYFPIIRNNLAPILQQFDFPDPTMPTGARNTTSVAPQSLLLMNAPWILEASRRAAVRLLDREPSDSARLHAAFQSSLGRSPTERETGIFSNFLHADWHTATGETEPRDREAMIWSLVLQNLAISNEFFYVR